MEEEKEGEILKRKLGFIYDAYIVVDDHEIWR